MLGRQMNRWNKYIAVVGEFKDQINFDLLNFFYNSQVTITIHANISV